MGYSIQELRTDSAKEVYENRAFIDWLTEHGVRRYASALDAQYQNGFAEVTMQQIQNLVRCALYQSGLPHTYWGEAFMYSIFTWNRTPKLLAGGVTPYEMVTGKIPDVKFMHPFGCQASAKHHRDDLPKFAPRGRPCVLIGYDLIRKAYRLLTLDDLSIITRAPRDVTFDDHKFPVSEHKLSQTMRNLFSDATLDSNSKPCDDYVDFFVPNPPLANPGGVPPPEQPPSTPPLQIRRIGPFGTPAQTPPLVLPSTPMNSTQENMTWRLHEPHFEGESPQAPPDPVQNAPPIATPYTPTPQTPTFNHGPLDLQRVWGTTPTFFKNIPMNLPRLRTRSNLHANVMEEILEEIMPTETEIHECLDFEAAMSEIHSRDVVTPKTYTQAISLPESDKWMQAMEKEMTAIIEAGTYDLIPAESVQPGAKVATPVWSFRIKFDGTFKARLCFPGHRQQYGVDYFDTESPVAKFATF